MADEMTEHISLLLTHLRKCRNTEIPLSRRTGLNNIVRNKLSNDMLNIIETKKHAICINIGYRYGYKQQLVLISHTQY
jgi:hypothetical protein